MLAVVILMSLGVISTSYEATDPPALTSSQDVAPVTEAAPADILENEAKNGQKPAGDRG